MNSSETRRRAHRHGGARSIGTSLADALRRAGSAAAVGSALIAGSAFAGTGGLVVSVDPLITPDPEGVKSVSYSTATTYYAAFAASIANPTTSNVNNAWFKVRTSVTNGLTAQFETASLPGACAVDPQVLPSGTGLVCQFTTVITTTPAVFNLLVKSPQAPVSGPTSTLSLLWTIQAGQGNSDANPSQVVQQETQDITLKVGSATVGVRSWVKAGEELGVTDTTGTTTEVKPPAPVTVGVKQVVSPSSCSPHYKQCFESTIRIVDESGAAITFPAATPLIVELFRDASTLKKNAKFANATLFYRAVFPDGSLGPSQEIVSCINGPTWQIPGGADRCVVPATKPANTLSFSDASGWHFHVIARTNGIIDW